MLFPSEGDNCPYCQRSAIICTPDGPCSCSTSRHPPCSACENSVLKCRRCGWEVGRYDDIEALNVLVEVKSITEKEATRLVGMWRSILERKERVDMVFDVMRDIEPGAFVARLAIALANEANKVHLDQDVGDRATGIVQFVGGPMHRQIMSMRSTHHVIPVIPDLELSYLGEADASAAVDVKFDTVTYGLRSCWYDDREFVSMVHDVIPDNRLRHIFEADRRLIYPFREKDIMLMERAKIERR